jgi:hypothetical protein
MLQQANVHLLLTQDCTILPCSERDKKIAGLCTCFSVLTFLGFRNGNCSSNVLGQIAYKVRVFIIDCCMPVTFEYAETQNFLMGFDTWLSQESLISPVKVKVKVSANLLILYLTALSVV